ncbi:MAG: hypothetical protein WAM53_18825 [Terrimicrobiaceae bacterium]
MARISKCLEFFPVLERSAGKRRVDRARADRVHADAFGGVFEGRGPG